MKIIRKGTVPENVIYNGTCKYCNAVVECTGKEASARDLGDRYSGAFITHEIKCPTTGCEYTITLEEGNFVEKKQVL